jgi:hypothetical protein
MAVSSAKTIDWISEASLQADKATPGAWTATAGTKLAFETLTNSFQFYWSLPMNQLIKQIASDANWSKWVAANSVQTAGCVSGKSGCVSIGKQGCVSIVGRQPAGKTGCVS